MSWIEFLEITALFLEKKSMLNLIFLSFPGYLHLVLLLHQPKPNRVGPVLTQFCSVYFLKANLT